jgi:hypothetical protein
VACETCPVALICFGAGTFHAYECACGRLSFIEYFPQYNAYDSEEDFDLRPVIHVVWCPTPQQCGRRRHAAGCPHCKPEEWRNSNNRRVKFTDYSK